MKLKIGSSKKEKKESQEPSYVKHKYDMIPLTFSVNPTYKDQGCMCVSSSLQRDTTQTEIDVLDVPTVRANYRALYATIMTNGSETWKALAYLNALKEKLSAFDFRIRFNSDHLPIGIVWMTHEMKRHLLQYGNIIFLDAQKRQYNKLC